MTDLYYLIPIGVLAGTNIAACVGWRITLRRADRLDDRGYAQFCRAVEAETARDTWRTNALHLQGRLDAQASKRSAAAKHARAAQIAKAKALRDATTAQLAGEVQAKARELRVAA